MTYLDDVRSAVGEAFADDEVVLAFPSTPAGTAKSEQARLTTGFAAGGALGALAANGIQRVMQSGDGSSGTLPVRRTSDNFPRQALVIAVGHRSIEVFTQGARSKPGAHVASVPLAEVEKVYLDKIRFMPKAKQLTMLFRDRSHVTVEIARNKKPDDVAATLSQLLAARG